MKTFWKVLGFAALAAGLTPYKVEKNEETGENNYQALLWRGTSKPGEGDEKRNIAINLGEGTLTSMLMDAIEKKNEAHLFSDELSVEYHAPEAEEAVEEAAEAAEEAVEPEEPAEPVEPEEPVEAEEPAEPEEPEEPKSEE